MKSTVNYAPFRHVLLIFLGAVLVLFVGLRYYDAWKTARAIREDPRQRTAVEFFRVFNDALNPAGFTLTDDGGPWLTLSTFHYSRPLTLTLPNGGVAQCLLETTQPERRAIVRRVTLSWDAAPDAPYVTVLTEALLDIFEPGLRTDSARSSHTLPQVLAVADQCEAEASFLWFEDRISTSYCVSSLTLSSKESNGRLRKMIVFELVSI